MFDQPPRLRVAMNALSVAMSAKSRTLDPQDVGALQVRAEELLDHADPVFRAVSTFATQFELHRRAPDEWYELGRALHQAISVAVTPAPPDMDRSDING